jgi:hypothetical protein
MTEDCVRSITFEIPGKNGSHEGVQIYAEEHDGTIVFTIESLGGDDLRGFFFHLADESLLDGLEFTNLDPLITETRVGLNNVIDMGNGANMHGAVSEGFDVGLEFGTPGVGHDVVSGPISFTLSHESQDLTLDDIAHVLFGARMTSSGAKITELSPAAPDAVDDSFDIFEDGASGLDDPSTTPVAVPFDVLVNDTDADGDILQITDAYGALHGTLEVVDDPDGDFILYTPDEDFAGTDTFTYCIDDGDGGTDFAVVNVDIEAVADIPDLTYEILAGDVVNEIRIVVTAEQTDADSSEFIDSIFLTGIPGSVLVTDGGVIDPLGEPDSISHEFILTLPLGADTSFVLGINAVAEETSNGDQQLVTATELIAFEHNLNEFDVGFTAGGSLWGPGPQFTFDDERFIGLDDAGSASTGGFFDIGVEWDFRIGFESDLHFEGGEVNAQLDYDVDIETNYNLTTDVLMISSEAILVDGDFQTEGPEGTYDLDFVFDFFAGFFFNLDGNSIIDSELGPISESFNLLSVDETDIGIEIPLGGGFALQFSWPQLDTDADPSAPPDGEFSSSGASNNFVQLDLDVDEALATLLGIPNPFDIGFDVDIVVAGASGNLELLDFDVFGGLNFLQDFVMQVQSLPGVLTFEDGTVQAFTFGTDIVINGASAIDAAGDGDGNVEFSLSLSPDATFNNSTDLGFNVGYDFSLLQASGSYFVGPFSDSFSIGPAFSDSGSAAVFSIPVYDNTFDLAFNDQVVAFAA